MSSKFKLFSLILSTIFSFIIVNLSLNHTLGSVAVLAQSSNDWPSIESLELYPGMDPPWSRVVKIEDPFYDSYLAVFDKNNWGSNVNNISYSNEVITVWTRQNIYLLYCKFYHCERTVQLSIELGDQIFNLNEDDLTFPVNNNLAMALANVSTDKNIKIRLTQQSGQRINSLIGQGTVKTWATIYQSDLDKQKKN